MSNPHLHIQIFGRKSLNSKITRSFYDKIPSVPEFCNFLCEFSIKIETNPGHVAIDELMGLVNDGQVEQIEEPSFGGIEQLFQRRISVQTVILHLLPAILLSLQPLHFPFTDRILGHFRLRCRRSVLLDNN